MGFIGDNQRTRNDFVDFWANYVKNNPKKWQKPLKEFLNAQIVNATNFQEKLLRTKGGADKIIKLYRISNPKIVARLKSQEGDEELKLYR
ncbi:MAG: hypothetical protein ACOCXG_05370 [Nanoarchaeota archaeon]